MVPWTPSEDALLLEKVQEFGRRWVRIAEFFPMRTDVHVKNRFIVLQRREKRDAEGESMKANAPRPIGRPLFPSLCDFAPPVSMIPPLNVLRNVGQGKEPTRKRSVLPPISEEPSGAWGARGHFFA
jgi:hypothetical protein